IADVRMANAKLKTEKKFASVRLDLDIIPVPTAKLVIVGLIKVVNGKVQECLIQNKFVFATQDILKIMESA
ncbi:hypothetical protein AVEN_81533-1, partial [Araneus ventricosus]